jgi:ADP-heptose:LPS heptosyltransferase
MRSAAASPDVGAPLAVVLRPLGLGDFLTGVPAYRAIARAFAGHRIVLAAPSELEPLAALSGCFDRLVPTRPLVSLAPELHGADIAIDLHGRGPASHRVLLAAEPRRLVAFRNAEVPQSADGAVWRPDEHEVERWCRMLAHAGIAADPADLALPVPDCAVPGFVHGATLLHPSAASEARRWPVERWIAVARAERGAGRTVIVTGGPGDRERAARIAAGAGLSAATVFAGRTGLRELAALVAAAGRVVCGDTGVAHLATAYDTPSVVLFGPISPALWGPPRRPHFRALWAGRSGDPHGSTVDPGLLEIGVEQVAAELASLAAEAERRPRIGRLAAPVLR